MHVAQADLSTFLPLKFLSFLMARKFDDSTAQPWTSFRLSHVQEKLNIPYPDIAVGSQYT